MHDEMTIPTQDNIQMITPSEARNITNKVLAYQEFKQKCNEYIISSAKQGLTSTSVPWNNPLVSRYTILQRISLELQEMGYKATFFSNESQGDGLAIDWGE